MSDIEGQEILLRYSNGHTITNQEYEYLVKHNYITETGSITSNGYHLISNSENGI